MRSSPGPADPARPSSASRPSRLYGLAVALYVLAFPYHPGLRSPNELCRLWQARAIVEYGTLDLNQTIRDYGYVGDLSIKDGRLYPSKAPLLSFLAVPIYKAISVLRGGYKYAVPELPLVYFSRLLLTVLPTLGLLVLVRRFLLAYASPEVADGVTLTYALGSLAFSYSELFISHQATAVLLFAAFYAIWRCARGDWRERGYLTAGAAAGAALMAEYTSGLGVIGLVFYGALSVLRLPLPGRERAQRLLRAGGLALAGAVPFVAALMAYHTACFGGPLESGYKHLLDAAYQPWHLGGFMGIRTPDPRAFALSFFSPLRGLFTLSPFLLLALPGLGLLHRASAGKPQERALFWLSVALLLGYAYFTSSFSYESWGWTTGPRHLTGLVPFLLLQVALTFERLRASAGPRSAALLGASAGLCAGSILVTGILTFVNYIPDSVSSPFFGLALPLFRQGFLPPSLLSLWIPTPLSDSPLYALRLLLSPGALLLIGLVAAAVGTFALLRGPMPRRWVVGLAGALACAAYLGLLAAATRGDAADLGAQQHLRSVWLTPPGRTITFFPSAGG